MMFLLALCASALSVTYGTLLDSNALTDRSSDVIAGTVEKVLVERRDGLIVSTVLLNVSHQFVGLRKQNIEFEVLGGELDGVKMEVPGAPKFTKGSEVLLFLDGKSIVGFGQGAYSLVRDQDPTKSGEENITEQQFSPTDRSLRAVRNLGNQSDSGPDQKRDSSRLLPMLDLPDQESAHHCLELKVWDDYTDDWSLRVLDLSHVRLKEYKTYPVTVIGGLEYEFLSCADEKARSLRLTLYTEEGELIRQESSDKRSIRVVYQSRETSTIYIALSAEDVLEEGKQVGLSLGVLYR